MFENFHRWMLENQDAVSWFIIGLCTGEGINSLLQGRYVAAAISFGIAYLNYRFTKIRM